MVDGDFVTRDRRTDSSPSEREFQVIYWPTERVCATYDTADEAELARQWYEKTYGPLSHGHLGVREVARDNE